MTRRCSNVTCDGRRTTAALPWLGILAALISVALVAFAGAGCGPNASGGGTTGDGGLGDGASGDDAVTVDASDPNSDDDGDGYTENQGDCNDSNPAVHPAQDEVCGDGLDNDCDGHTDGDQPDADGDGYGPCRGDCDDTNPNVHPGAEELDGNGVDDDCDGIIDGDFDGDGYTVADGDCNDHNPLLNPGIPENCYDGVDNDCDGYTDGDEPDADGDGYGPCQGDCDDTNPNVYPGAPEIAGNGIDDNCDFLVDEDIDGDGWTEANGDCDDTNPDVNPSVFETCGDNVDNNCDGVTDQNCLGPCEVADLTRSSVGCVYYAVDCNNDPAESYDTRVPFAVVVSNTDSTNTANVVVQTRSGGTWQTIQTAAVAPMSLHEFDLPDRHINYTGINQTGAYRVVADRPVIAYQFQPIDGVNSYTSDASLLLPTGVLDTYYYVVGWGAGYGRPQINIVATQDDTTVTITSSVSTDAGGGVAALSPGTPYTAPSLAEGDYLQIQASSSTSFTGTYITSNKPIVVFSAHTCANIPAMGCCCDHLEEQLFGLQTWGNTFVAARMPVRSHGAVEATIWQVFASENDTNVSFLAAPGVTGLPASPQTLQQGAVLTLTVSGTTAQPGDFVVTADKPILVMEYLSSSYNVSGASTAEAGDPAMTQMVPVEQFLDSYVVLVPSNWVYDYFILIAPKGATINMDGTPVPATGFIDITDGNTPAQWSVTRITAPDGIHVLDGDSPFGIVVLGYDAYDSYAYPGGLDQQVINPIN